MEKINNLRKEANEILIKANKFIDEGLLSSACIELKKSILKAEEVFHLTNDQTDKEFLLDAYMKIGKYYSKIYNITLDKKDILPACMYYEKIIYFYEEELRQKNKKLIILLNKLMEAYIQLIWISLEIKDYKIFKKFINKAYKHSSKLARKSKMYEDEQYYILVNIFNGDYYKANNKLKTAYFYYLIAMNRMSKIYNTMPNDGIRNDLILIYNNLSEVAKKLKRSKAKIKWDSLIKELQKENEVNENV